MFPWSSERGKLRDASKNGDVATVRELLVRGVEICGDLAGYTPLHFASSRGHLPVVEIRLKAHADVNAASVFGDSPLHEASSHGYFQVVELLLKARANVNAANKNQLTPLHIASRFHLPVVEVLLKAHADPIATDKWGDTPLHEACETRQSKTVRALLAGGANLHAENNIGREPLHTCIESHEDTPVNKDTVSTLQALVSFGATWDAKCDATLVEHSTYSALRLCTLLWAKEHADGLGFSDIPIEVIKRGADSTQAFISNLNTSRDIVHRHKICLVGSSCAGKTSFVKSITSELLKPQLEHLDDRTIGIDHFPLRFEQSMTNQKETKIHEVTFWDFAGQDAYQVAHSLFFSPRTMYLVCVDLEAFTMAFLQASIMAHVKKQEKQLMDEFIDRKVMHWIRLILARQPDAELVFIAMKEDLLEENEAAGNLLKTSLLAKLKEVEATVGEMRKNEPKTDESDTLGLSAFSSKIETNPPNVLFTSSTSPTCVRAARDQVQDLIIKSERSFVMPDIYSQALEAIKGIRESAKGHDVTSQIKRIFAPVDSLPAALQIEPELCRTILQTLHDLGYILWYEDLGIDLFDDTVILDPLLLIDFIRQVINHKHTGVTMPHSDLKSLPYWESLSDKTQMKAIKQLLQKFRLAYPDDDTGLMHWDSDLIVPAFWQTKTPASWLFLGDILRTNSSQSKEDAAVRVDWEYHFEYGLPSPLFDHLVVASVSPHYKFDAGPDWILYEEKGVAACRIMVGRDVKSLQRTIHVEAVVAELADTKQIARLWGTFKQLCGAFVDVMRGYPGLAVSSFAWDDTENKINMKRLVQSSAPEESAKWMPPPATWEWFRQHVAHSHRTGKDDSN